MKKIRIIPIALLIFMMLLIGIIPAMSAEKEEGGFLLGDVSLDGEVTILDATLIQRYLSSEDISLNDEQLQYADCDHDGKVTVVDANIISKKMLKYNIVYPVGIVVTEEQLDTVFGAVEKAASSEPSAEPAESGGKSVQRMPQRETVTPIESPPMNRQDVPLVSPTTTPVPERIASPAKVDFAPMKGVDVSYANGDVDMQKIKDAGFEFVMIRCGYGSDMKSQDDSQYENNVKKAEQVGMYWGTYLYSYALNVSDAQSEVAHTTRLLKGKKPSMPIAFDMEDADGYKERNGFPSNQTLVDICKTYLSGIKDAGYYPILYTGLDYIGPRLNNDPTLIEEYDIWFAQWWTECEYDGSNLGMWQYGGEVNFLEDPAIPGVGLIDQNYCYRNYPEIIRSGGYNNWSLASYNMVDNIIFEEENAEELIAAKGFDEPA